jgi:hypothetical protein
MLREQPPSVLRRGRTRGWTEGIVLRAVATRLACEGASAADEVYALLDEILRFAATRGKRNAKPEACRGQLTEAYSAD